jgi:hypothetical protein
VVCTDVTDRGFLYNKVCTWQEVYHHISRHCQWNAKSAAIKTSGNEKMQVTAMLTELADGTKQPTMCDWIKRTMSKVQLPKGLIIMYLKDE